MSSVLRRMALVVAGTAVMVGIGSSAAFAATGGQPVGGPAGSHPTAGHPPVACSITLPVLPGTPSVPAQPVHTGPAKPVPPGTPGVPAQSVGCWILPSVPGAPGAPATPIGQQK
ncbi:MAG TPA: hypothetical protein VGH57_21265 [Amycolatopsis sp.]